MFGSSSYSVYIISFFFSFLSQHSMTSGVAMLDWTHLCLIGIKPRWKILPVDLIRMDRKWWNFISHPLPINCKCVCGVIDSFTYFVYVVYTYILKWWSTPRNCVPINLIFAVSIHINSRFHTHTQCILFHYIFLLYIFLVYFFFVHERTAGPGRVKCRQSIMV